MTLLITGGGGFVMSNLARHWLDSDPAARAVVVDAAPLDELAVRYFEPVRDRLSFVQADVCDEASWRAIGEAHDIRHVVHGATITSFGAGQHPDAPPGGAYDDPRRLFTVNVMGTATMLHWAATTAGIERVIYVSSGSVYGADGPAQGALPEDGYVAPDGFYPISKYTAELMTGRYARGYGLPAVSVRLASVYGPMDRVTPGRSVCCTPNRIAHLALAGETVRVNALDAIGDYIHAGDCADALIAMLRAPTLSHPVYNIAYGESATVADLIAMTAEHVPGLRFEEVPADEAHIVENPSRRTGRWGAYSIARLQADTGWQPRPLKAAMHHYIDWIRDFETA